jgi:hypothetical protein
MTLAFPLAKNRQKIGHVLKVMIRAGEHDEDGGTKRVERRWIDKRKGKTREVEDRSDEMEREEEG